MKYVFIINPNSGQKELKDDLIQQLSKYENIIDYEIYITKESKDATKYVDQYCNNYDNDVVFCACGGDGTINEVVSGMVGHKNAILACYPCGSGNDFVKVYGKREQFLSIDNLINAKEISIDIMKVNDKYSLNVTNFGFEVAVCDVANKIRRKKIIGGRNSYTSGIIAAVFKSRKNKCKIVADDNLLIDGNILLSTFANGKYVGGAYCCAPYSDNSDGLLEVSIVKPISLLRFISLIGPYKKGSHLSNKKLKKFIIYTRANKVTIDTPINAKICLDGEIYQGKHFEIENLKQKIRFLKP